MNVGALQKSEMRPAGVALHSSDILNCSRYLEPKSLFHEADGFCGGLGVFGGALVYVLTGAGEDAVSGAEGEPSPLARAT